MADFLREFEVVAWPCLVGSSDLSKLNNWSVMVIAGESQGNL